MKKFFAVCGLTMAAIAFTATPAVAGDDDNYDHGNNSGCFGNLCPGSSISIIALGQAGHVGEFGGIFDAGENGTGEAGSEADGGSSIDTSITFNSCGDDSCPSNNVEGNVSAWQTGRGWSWAESATSGVPAMSATMGQSEALAAFSAGVCDGGCPTGGNDD